MIPRRLENLLAQRRCTLLGVGPMSRNCVDATIELSNEHLVPILLIASRRQIDSEAFGGGYVNNWSTQQFADYVTDKDKQGKIILARDHGGPWQSEKEKAANLSLHRAMASAKESYRADIDAGFQIIHIDPSVDIHGTPSVDEVLERIFELYEFCWSYAQKTGRTIAFEIGTEEQSGGANFGEELEYTLAQMKKFCGQTNMPFPGFVVVQIGTLVMEMRNIGSFDFPVRIEHELPAVIQVPMMIEICKKYNILMKVHNTDYLGDDSLSWYPKLGIQSANVAPEYGVAETMALIEILKKHKLDSLAERFIALSYNSNKWKKWMIPETSAGKMERAIIAGHYVFSAPEFLAIKAEAEPSLRKHGIELDEYLKSKVKTSIMRYLKDFRLVSN